MIAGELVIGTCGWLGYGNEVIALRTVPDGERIRTEEVYRIARAAPLCVTPLVVGDLLFVWSDNGVVTCADSQTGEIHWRRRAGGDYYSSPVCAAGRVFNISTSGEVVVLAASREYELLARNQLPQGTHSTPAIAGDVMYVRTFSQLTAIGSRR